MSQKFTCRLCWNPGLVWLPLHLIYFLGGSENASFILFRCRTRGKSIKPAGVLMAGISIHSFFRKIRIGGIIKARRVLGDRALKLRVRWMILMAYVIQE